MVLRKLKLVLKIEGMIKNMFERFLIEFLCVYELEARTSRVNLEFTTYETTGLDTPNNIRVNTQIAKVV